MATKWVRSNDVIWEEMNEAALLVRPETGARWSLNATAARIWKFCDGRCGLTEIAQSLSATSGRSLRETKRQIAAFCTEFAALGLLKPAAGAATSADTMLMTGLSTPPAFRSMGLGSGPRRRPSPRGNSGPG